jgi:hypothetical protein
LLLLTPAITVSALLVPSGGIGPGPGEGAAGVRPEPKVVEYHPSNPCRFYGTEGTCELERIAAEVGLPEEARELAIPICCTMVERKLARGREIGIVAGSSIYTACRESRVPITLKELARAAHTTPRELGRIYMLILDRMEIKPPNPNGNSYIDKVATRIHTSEEVAKLSQEIERRALDAGLGGRNPMSLAAAALYTASLDKGEPVTQSDLAEAAGVSVISLRESAKWMRSFLRARKGGLSDSLRFAAYLASLIGVVMAVLISVPIFA